MDRSAVRPEGKPVRRLLDDAVEALVRRACAEMLAALMEDGVLRQIPLAQAGDTGLPRRLLASVLEEPMRRIVADALELARRYGLRPRRGPRARAQAAPIGGRWVRLRLPSHLVEEAHLAARLRGQGLSELVTDAVEALLSGVVPLEPPLQQAWWQVYRQAEARRPGKPVRLVDIYRAMQAIYPVTPETFREVAARFCLASWPKLLPAEEKDLAELTQEERAVALRSTLPPEPESYAVAVASIVY